MIYRRAAMETKEDLVANLKAWMKLDAEIRGLRKETRDRVSKQKELSNVLIELMKTNDIDTLNTNEMHISCVQKETKGALSKKYLESVLLEYYENNSQKATEVQDYIMSHRTTSVKDCLKTKRM